MSILIKGMEMPTNCEKCPFEREVLSRYVCAISGKARNWGLETRLSDCPLVPVPPHGDLIDASTKVTIQTYDDMYEEYRYEKCTIADALDQWSDEGCPEAIIPASEEGE